MNVEWIRKFCLALPHTTESTPFGPDHLVFKVAGKMYLIAAMEPGPTSMSFKSTPEEFADLVELPGVIPAPYMARNHWVALEDEDALPPAEIKRLIRRSYDLVVEKLPKKTRAALKA